MTTPPGPDDRAGSGWSEQDRRILRDMGSSLRIAAFALVFMLLMMICGAIRALVS